jgi:hypothetical protein
MAEINRESQEFAEIMAQVNREMRMYGELHVSTAERLKDAEMKTKYGLDGFSKASSMGADALSKFGEAAFSSGKALLDGKKGASALNSTMDQLTDSVKMAAVALTFLVPGGPLIKGLVAGIGLLTVSVLEAGKKYTQAANTMSDQLYKGYQDLAQSGAAASDGMTGLFNDAKKLGLSMNEIGQYTELIAANSKDLALFSGTVFEGRKQFADMGKGMEQYREGLMNAGLTQEQINAGAMGYLKLQSRIGLSQNKTTTELADGAKKYLLEMDALGKVTGESRKAMEDQMEAARSEERFAAKLQELRSQGPAGIAAAKELELTNIMLAKENKQLAQGFRDASTGMITTEAAQKANLVTQGQVMVQADRMSAGLAKAGEGATIIGQAAGNTAKSMTGLAKAGAYGDVFGDYASDLRSGMTDYNKALIAAEKEQENQGAKGGKAADAAVQAQTDLVLMQQKGNEAVERFVFAGVVPATKAMTVLVEKTTLAAGAMAKMFGVGVGPQAPKAESPSLGQAKQDLDASTEKAALANERAQAAEKDANMSRAEKDRIKKEARESEAAVAQDIRIQREAQLKEQNARRAARRAGTAAPAGGGAAPAAGGGAAPAAAVGGGAAGGGGAAPATSSSAPATRSAAPAAHGQSGGASDGKPKLARVSSASGKSASVNEKYAPAFQNLLDYLGNVGYNVTSLGGYNDRDATGQPGVKSIHAHGAAIDINPGANPFGSKLITDMPPEIGQIAASLGLGWGGNWKSVKDAMHFSAARSEGGSLLKASDGGVFQGPSSGYNVELHGKEAVIPLKDGAVPVSLSLKDALNTPTFAGKNEYAGYNMGPMSTDIEAVKKLAEAVGAFDKTSQIITDPETWKQILSSGLATNYKLVNAELGSKMLPGLDQDMADRLKEIKEQGNTTTEAALKQVGEELKQGLSSMAEKLAVIMTGRALSMETSEMLPYLQELISATKSGVDVQQKILATSY